MGKRDDDRPHGRFGRSGHTTHLPRQGHPPDAPTRDFPTPPPGRTAHDSPTADFRPPPYRPPQEPPPYRPPQEPPPYRPPHRPAYDPGSARPADPGRHVPPDRTRDLPPYDSRPATADPRYRSAPPRSAPPPPPRSGPPPHRSAARDPYRSVGPNDTDAFDAPIYHQSRPTQSATVGSAALGLGRATVVGTNKAARTVTRKVIAASQADGARESGLTALIWNQVLSYGTDAMITVALAGTVFFGASANAQRGNVLLYLLVTMAPFAVVAPIIGPALDRLQHGRRWTMAATALGRGILALVMAGHPTDLLVLYPCALGSLVLSKAYGVLRAAAAPRLVPPGMTLTAANAKLTIFGFGSTVVLGGLVGAIIKVTGSYTAGLIVTAIGFFACTFFAVKLPKQVDSAQPAPRHPEEPVRPRRQEKVPPLRRIQEWARHGFDHHLVIALQGESVLRMLSGMLTIYLAFYVEATKHGFAGAVELAGVVGGAGAGNFVGTAIGTRLRGARPESVLIISTCVAALTCVVAALTFTIEVGLIALFVCSVTNALGKIALDSLIQNDVLETLRSSAFARSETFLQLAWVVGAAIAVAVPSTSTTDGSVALGIDAAITVAVAAVTILRTRAMKRLTAAHEPRITDTHPGSVVPRSID